MKTRNLKQIFKWPIVMSLLITFGLVVALLADGVIEDISLFTLVVPILTIVYFYYYKN